MRVKAIAITLLVSLCISTVYTAQTKPVTAEAATPAPSGISIVAENGSATITWESVSGAKTYALFLKDRAGNVTLVHNRINGTSYDLSGLRDNERYGFVLKAYTSGGWSGYSATNWVTCNLVTKTPENVTVTPGDGEVTVSWTPSYAAQTYAVFLKDTSGNVTLVHNRVNGTSYTIKGLKNDVRMGFVVKAYVNRQWSTWSKVAWATPTEAKKVPENLHAETENEKVLLSWDEVPQAEKYAVYLKNKSGTTLLNSNVRENCLEVTGLPSNENVGFTVKAFVKGKWYDYSSVLWVKIPEQVIEPTRDLGGMTIIIGDHWSPAVPSEPGNAYEEATKKYRDEIFKKYNFTMQSKAVAGWNEMTDTYIDSVLAGEPAAQLFELDYRFVAEPMTRGLFYDLATLEEFDFSEEKWNQAVKNLMTQGDSIYGMRADKSEPRGGVVWNKRLFEEAGIDPDLPYDLQASGQWTWSAFEELCERLTRDTNGDGVTDVYGTVSQGATTMTCLVASTGSDFFKKGADGTLSFNMDSEEVMAALNFAVDLYNKGYEMPQPADSQWDYFIPAFQQGKAAMQFNEEYVCQPSNVYGDEMEDEVGFVLPPKPDGASAYHSYVCDNITVIPSCYDAETASNIAFAYNLYTALTPGYDDPDDWKDAYYSHFEDERAVDETIAKFNDGTTAHFLLQALVPEDLGEDLLWVYPFEHVTPEEQVTSIKDSWNRLLAEINQGVVSDRLSLNCSSINDLKVGESRNLIAYVNGRATDASELTWESSNPSVATCNNGRLVGVGTGTAIITCTTENGATAKCTVTITKMVSIIGPGGVEFDLYVDNAGNVTKQVYYTAEGKTGTNLCEYNGDGELHFINCQDENGEFIGSARIGYDEKGEVSWRYEYAKEDAYYAVNFNPETETCEFYFMEGGTERDWSCYYNGDGDKLVSDKLVKNGEVVSHIENRYNNGAVVEYTVYEYNGENRSKATLYNSNDEVVEYMLYEYKNGELYKTTTYDSNDVLKRSHVIEYYENGKVKSETNYNADGAITGKNVYSYDEDGNRTGHKEYGSYREDGLPRQIWEYDGNWNYLGYSILEYNEDKTVKKILKYDRNGVLIEETDGEGNVIEAEVVEVTSDDGVLFKLELNEDGTVRRQEYYVNGELAGRNELFYYGNGRLSNMNFFSAQGSNVGWVNLGYNGDGVVNSRNEKATADVYYAMNYNLENGSCEFYSVEGGTKKEWNTYKNDGYDVVNDKIYRGEDVVSHIEYRYKNGALETYKVYEYNNGNCYKWTKYNNNDVVTEYCLFERYEDGKIKAEACYSADDLLKYKDEYSVEGKWERKLSYTYDSEKNLVAYNESIYEEIKKGHWYEVRNTKYDSNGVMVNYKISEWYEDGTLKESSQYDSNNHLQWKSEYDEEGNCKGQWSYSYDVNGNLEWYRESTYEELTENHWYEVKQTQYDANGVMMSSTEYEYNEQGRMNKRLQYNAAGDLLEYTVFVYDVRGNQTENRNYKPDGTMKSKQLYSYDENGNRTGHTEYSDYRENGLPHRITEYGSNWNYLGYSIMEYNDDGSVKKISKYSLDGTLIEETDGEGNIIENEAVHVTGPNGIVFDLQLNSAGKVVKQSYQTSIGIVRTNLCLYQKEALNITFMNENNQTIGNVSVNYADGKVSRKYEFAQEEVYYVLNYTPETGECEFYFLEGGTERQFSYYYNEMGELREYSEDLYATFTNGNRYSVKKIWYSANGEELYYNKYEYNESGQCIKESSYDVNDVKMSYIEYLYNDLGLPIEQTNYTAEGIICEKKDYKYDADSQRIGFTVYTEWSNGKYYRVTEYNNSWNVLNYSIVEYNDDGSVKKVSKYSADGVFIEETDGEGNVIEAEVVEVTNDDGVLFKLELNEDGTVRRQEYYIDGELAGRNEVSYNGDGRLSNIAFYDASGAKVGQAFMNYNGGTLSYREERASKDVHYVVDFEPETKNCKFCFLEGGTEKQWRSYYNGDGVRFDDEKITKDGQVVSHINKHYRDDSIIGYTVNEYNGSNLYKASTYDSDGTLTKYTIYEQYEDGKTKSETQYYSDGRIQVKKEYDTEGVWDKEIYYSYDSDDVLLWYRESKYVELAQGQWYQIYYTQYDANGVKQSYCEMEYNELRQMVMRREYNAENVLVSYEEIEYNNYGVQTERTNYNADGSIRWKDIYQYDENGNRIGVSEYNDYRADGLPYRISEYDGNWNYLGYSVLEYNADGTVKKISKYDRNGVLIEETDGEGNVIEPEVVEVTAEDGTLFKLELGENRAVRKQEYYIDGELAGRNEISYYGDGRLSEITFFNATGTNVGRVIFRYDGNGKLNYRHEQSSADVHYVLNYNPTTQTCDFVFVEASKKYEWSTNSHNGFDYFHETTWAEEEIVSKVQYTYKNDELTDRFVYGDFRNGTYYKWTRYDGQGNMLEYTVIERYENGVVKKETGYNPDGRVTRIDSYDTEGKRDDMTTFFYFYDSSGNLQWYTENEHVELAEGYWGQIKQTQYDANGVMQSYIEFEYNALRQQVKQFEYDANGVLTAYGEREFNESGLESVYVCYNADDSIRFKRFTHYDENGSRTGHTEYWDYRSDGLPYRVSEYNAKWECLYYSILEYNADGTVKKISKYSPNGTLIEETDGEGNVIEKDVVEVTAEDGTLFKLEFDENGTQVKQTYYVDGELNGWSELGYNVDGILVSFTFYNASGNNVGNVNLDYYNGVQTYWFENASEDVCYVMNYDPETETCEFCYAEAGTNTGWRIAYHNFYDMDQNLLYYTEKLTEYADGRWLETKVTEYGPDGVKRAVTEHEYNEQGQKIKSNIYDANGALSSYSLYSYNELGQQDEYWNYDADGTELTHRISKYNDLGQRSEFWFYDTDGKLTSKTLFHFDESGVQTGQTEYFDYREDGLPYAMREYQNWVLVYSATLEYDESGNMVKVTKYDANGNLIGVTDGEGNPIGANTAEVTNNDGVLFKLEFDENGEEVRHSYYVGGELQGTNEIIRNEAGIMTGMNLINASGENIGQVVVCYTQNGRKRSVERASEAARYVLNYNKENGSCEFYTVRGRTRVEYTYDDRGVELENRFYEDEVLTKTRYYSYDANGNGTGYTEESDYSADGRCGRLTVYDNEHTMLSYSLLEYDDAGNVNKQITYNADEQMTFYAQYSEGVLIGAYSFEYHENGRLKKQTTINGDKVPLVHEAYDQSGNMIEMAYYYYNAGVCNGYTSTFYDADGNVTGMTRYNPDGTEKEPDANGVPEMGTLPELDTSKAGSVANGTGFNSREEAYSYLIEAVLDRYSGVGFLVDDVELIYTGEELCYLFPEIKSAEITTFNRYANGYYVKYSITPTYRIDGDLVYAIRTGDTSTLDKDEREPETYSKLLQLNESLGLAEMSDMDVILTVHDYLVLNATYDHEEADNGTNPDAHYASGALLDGLTVCSGYASAFRLLMMLNGIECEYAWSESDNHGWNLVTLDGKDYWMDVTWDDPDMPDTVLYTYFMTTSEKLAEAGGHSNWQCECGGSHTCDSTEYEMYMYAEYMCTTEEEAAALIAEQADQEHIVLIFPVDGALTLESICGQFGEIMGLTDVPYYREYLQDGAYCKLNVFPNYVEEGASAFSLQRTTGNEIVMYN